MSFFYCSFKIQIQFAYSHETVSQLKELHAQLFEEEDRAVNIWSLSIQDLKEVRTIIIWSSKNYQFVSAKQFRMKSFLWKYNVRFVNSIDSALLFIPLSCKLNTAVFTALLPIHIVSSNQEKWVLRLYENSVFASEKIAYMPTWWQCLYVLWYINTIYEIWLLYYLFLFGYFY